jgi:putative tryptophan/tyrosine transport system substrate-binding protein
MNRRHALQLAIGAVFAARASSIHADPAAAGLRRVGVLVPSTRAKEEITLEPFFDQMRELGWIQGQNIAYDRVYADDRHQELPRLAAAMVARKPELIYAPPQVAAVAARQATRTIPIVFATGTDPVGAGLAASLARPGGNATGVVSVIDSLAPKRLQLLREMLPDARRIGLVGDPNDPRLNTERGALASVAPALGMTIIVAEAASPTQLDDAVAQLLGQGVHVIFATTSISTNLRGRLVELASRSRVPVVGNIAAMAEAGALFTYGALLADQLRRSAQFVDKVLKGANPADLAIEQPTRFELVINAKTANALRIVIPRSLLLRADMVIE